MIPNGRAIIFLESRNPSQSRPPSTRSQNRKLHLEVPRQLPFGRIGPNSMPKVQVLLDDIPGCTPGYQLEAVPRYISKLDLILRFGSWPRWKSSREPRWTEECEGLELSQLRVEENAHRCVRLDIAAKDGFRLLDTAAQS